MKDLSELKTKDLKKELKRRKKKKQKKRLKELTSRLKTHLKSYNLFEIMIGCPAYVVAKTDEEALRLAEALDKNHLHFNERKMLGAKKIDGPEDYKGALATTYGRFEVGQNTYYTSDWVQFLKGGSGHEQEI